MLKGQSAVKWSFAPLETLYDVDAVIARWTETGVPVRYSRLVAIRRSRAARWACCTQTSSVAGCYDSGSTWGTDS